MPAADKRVAFKARAEENRVFAEQTLAGHNECQVLYIDDQKCFAGIASDALTIRGIPLFETRAASDADALVVALPCLISAELVDSKRLKRVVEMQREAKLVHHRKSPVMRGLVGTAMLGPVGTVLGAASGLNSRVELKHIDKRVTKVVEVEGPPSIVLGTNQPDRPVIRLRATDKSKTVEWYYRLRATLAA